MEWELVWAFEKRGGWEGVLSILENPPKSWKSDPETFVRVFWPLVRLWGRMEGIEDMCRAYGNSLQKIKSINIDMVKALLEKSLSDSWNGGLGVDGGTREDVFDVLDVGRVVRRCGCCLELLKGWFFGEEEIEVGVWLEKVETIEEGWSGYGFLKCLEMVRREFEERIKIRVRGGSGNLGALMVGEEVELEETRLGWVWKGVELGDKEMVLEGLKRVDWKNEGDQAWVLELWLRISDVLEWGEVEGDGSMLRFGILAKEALKRGEYGLALRWGLVFLKEEDGYNFEGVVGDLKDETISPAKKPNMFSDQSKLEAARLRALSLAKARRARASREKRSVLGGRKEEKEEKEVVVEIEAGMPPQKPALSEVYASSSSPKKLPPIESPDAVFRPRFRCKSLVELLGREAVERGICELAESVDLSNVLDAVVFCECLKELWVFGGIFFGGGGIESKVSVEHCHWMVRVGTEASNVALEQRSVLSSARIWAMNAQSGLLERKETGELKRQEGERSWKKQALEKTTFATRQGTGAAWLPSIVGRPHEHDPHPKTSTTTKDDDETKVVQEALHTWNMEGVHARALETIACTLWGWVGMAEEVREEMVEALGHTLKSTSMESVLASALNTARMWKCPLGVILGGVCRPLADPRGFELSWSKCGEVDREVVCFGGDEGGDEEIGVWERRSVLLEAGREAMVEKENGVWWRGLEDGGESVEGVAGRALSGARDGVMEIVRCYLMCLGATGGAEGGGRDDLVPAWWVDRMSGGISAQGRVGTWSRGLGVRVIQSDGADQLDSTVLDGTVDGEVRFGCLVGAVDLVMRVLDGGDGGRKIEEHDVIASTVLGPMAEDAVEMDVVACLFGAVVVFVCAEDTQTILSTVRKRIRASIADFPTQLISASILTNPSSLNSSKPPYSPPQLTYLINQLNLLLPKLSSSPSPNAASSIRQSITFLLDHLRIKFSAPRSWETSSTLPCGALVFARLILLTPPWEALRVLGSNDEDLTGDKLQSLTSIPRDTAAAAVLRGNGGDIALEARRLTHDAFPTLASQWHLLNPKESPQSVSEDLSSTHSSSNFSDQSSDDSDEEESDQPTTTGKRKRQKSDLQIHVPQALQPAGWGGEQDETFEEEEEEYVYGIPNEEAAAMWANAWVQGDEEQGVFMWDPAAAAEHAMAVGWQAEAEAIDPEVEARVLAGYDEALAAIQQAAAAQEYVDEEEQ